jgi:hypothetical protein
MKKSMFMGMAGILVLFLSTAMYAGTTVQDVIRMENKAYSKHTKGIVEFSHKKHMEDYKAGCGECHHDEKGKPLDGLKAGAPVQGCIECHKIPGEAPKGKDAPKLTKQQSLEYHADAVHDNCRECHKKFNKEKGLKAKDPGYAPTACTQCHPKN